MYCKLWNIPNVTSHYFLDCSLDQGKLKKVKWQLGSKCRSSHSILKTSIASRSLTPTGDNSNGIDAFEDSQQVFSRLKEPRK